MTKQMYEKLGRFHGLLLKVDLAILTFVLLPFVLIIEKFYKKENRANLWRTVACWITRTTFDLNGIKYKLKNAQEIINGPAIYAGNHSSEMDGFLLFAILGPKTILFTMPHDAFPAILKPWLRKMQSIDVARDEIDLQKYSHANSPAEAIRKAVEHLKNGCSLIIFPEGHIEKMHILHYFHTGTSRISLQSHIPIIPFSIINAENVLPEEGSAHPGTIIVNFCRALKPSLNDALDDRKKVRQLRDKMEQEIVANLPQRCIPPLYRQKRKDVGVFVDIDHTIYNGLSQKDLIVYLLHLHKMDYKEAYKIFYWLFMEKIGKIEHTDLMKKSLLTLHGWDLGDLDYYVHEAFAKKMLHRIQYGFYPLLKDHAEAGHKIILVSEVIHPLSKQFKNFVKATTSLDTKLQTTHHCYTGETPCLCYKQKKADLVKSFADHAQIDLAKSFAYADSHSDIPFLSEVKYPCAVNPDQELLTFAIKNDWDIMRDAS